ncbi:MAG: alanine--tRNA ligase [Rhodobacterales bacterium]|nr:alanine--tRNA ligase [Rhodobacterales bacterium]
MRTLNDIRSTFLDYFKRQGHEVVQSSPLVPRNDPTLMFANSGMVQFKNLFTGVETRDYKRAVTSQKCVRAGGKHNDLDNVGYTARHHTFFEMLGNFSFGDYFKSEAIPFAWELITKEFDIPKERLLVTVYHTDEEAALLWKKVAGLPDDKIIRISTNDNFWMMGATGPCGPCTEIFFDHGEKYWGGPPGSPEEDGDRFVEIWNLVFMQYEQFEDGTRKDLPNQSIDTGMGIERVAALLQGTNDNYETDLIRALIEASAEATSSKPDGDNSNHHRVIADHLRSTSFLIADGVMPSNEGRGYVLRRIMRRAMRHAHLVGAKDPVMHQLVPSLVGQMGAAYPELVSARALIEETLLNEETKFKQTLERGLKLLDEELDGLPSDVSFPGKIAFKLYDTYGFPLDLTQDALREAQAQVIAIVKDGLLVDSAAQGDSIQVVFNQTPFYGESGGQIGDTGQINFKNGAANIVDTKRSAGIFVHFTKVTSGVLSLNDPVELEVENLRRSAIRANHSATHLLHEALRIKLGHHVAQRGSLNAADRLRFDFSHSKALTKGELLEVERSVNFYIRQNTEVTTRVMSPDDARELGATALFGEKYGEEVRVVSMGYNQKSGKGIDGNGYSLELCGGTHVKRTGDIGAFVILSDGASSSGVRRIEALTGEAAMDHLAKQQNYLSDIAIELKSGSSDILSRVKSLMAERKSLVSEVAQLRKDMALGGSSSGQDELKSEDLSGVNFLAKQLNGIPGKELPSLIDGYKQRLSSGVILLISENEGKVAVASGVTKDLLSQISAVDIVKIAANKLGGKGGGGRPDFAQAGGSSMDGVTTAIDAVRSLIVSK